MFNSLAPRLRILVSAYGCGPGRGSEPGVGWNWSNQVAQFHDVWVLTPESERASIEAYHETDPSSKVHFVHCDLPSWLRPSNQGTLVRYHLHYHMWQILAFFIARGLDRQLHFHLVHHLTLGAHWKPSFLALLPIPFIWGPVGGAEEAPAALAASLGRKAWLYEKIRNLRLSVIDLDPFVKITARRAQIVLTKTEDTAARVRQFGARRVRVVSEAGLPEAELEYLGSLRPRSTQPFRFLCLGRLLYWKGFELAIRAFAESSRILTNVELWIVGDGPEMRRLQRIARDLGVSSTVRFLGQMPRSKGLEVLAECDVLVHPSLHDSGGWVCLEAMAAGKPVICLDLGGPGVQVTSEVGLKIRPTTTKQVITDIAQGMGRFASDREYATRLGAAARAHVRANFSWTRRGSVLSRIYSDAYAYAQDSNIANVSAQFTIPPAV